LLAWLREGLVLGDSTRYHSSKSLTLSAPIILHSYQSKELTERAFRKLLILKDAILAILG
jgi:hypothetical protein